MSPPTKGSPTLKNEEEDDYEKILEQLRNHDEVSEPVKRLLRAYDLSKSHDKNLKILR